MEWVQIAERIKVHCITKIHNTWIRADSPLGDPGGASRDDTIFSGDTTLLAESFLEEQGPLGCEKIFFWAISGKALKRF